MKRVELKRIAELLWKGTPDDEKRPFAQTPVPDNGAIEKNAAFQDLKSSEKEEEEEPMSLARKICFALSFNVCILYFIMLGWVIPCRLWPCRGTADDVKQRNFSNVWPLTNLETYNVNAMPELLILGYAGGMTLNLAAIDAETDDFRWNNSLTFIPRRIQCNFAIAFDANGDGIGDCLLTGYNDVYAFNVSDGYVFWQQSLPSDDGSIVSRFHPSHSQGNSTYLIGTCGVQILALDSRNGTKLTEADLPCWSPFDIRIVPRVAPTALTSWTVVCDYGDKVEAWSFAEQELLNKKKWENTGAEMFSLLFRRDSNSGESIDLGCDVTTIPGGPLLLSWSNRVAMVTSTTTLWEHRFPYPLSVASIKVGHFTNLETYQIAVATQNISNSILYILETTKGEIVRSVLLENRHIQDLHKISTGLYDSLVVTSMIRNFTSYDAYNMTDPISVEEHNFALAEFRSIPVVKSLVTVASILGSTVNSKQNGEIDLILLKNEESFLAYQKHIIHKNKLCSNKNQDSRFSSEM